MELMARAGDKKKFPSISLLIVFTVNPLNNVETMSFSRVLIRRASLAEMKNGEANHWAVLGREGRICRRTTTITMKNIRSVASRRFKCLNVPLHTTSGRQVESIFAEIHSRVEQKADARKIGAEEGTKERRRWKNTEERGGKGGEGAVANRAPGATNRISESRP